MWICSARPTIFVRTGDLRLQDELSYPGRSISCILHDSYGPVRTPRYLWEYNNEFKRHAVGNFFRSIPFQESIGPVHHKMFIKGLSGNSVTVWVNLDWTAGYLYSLLWRYGHDMWSHPGFFRLIYGGKQLFGSRSLREFHMKPMSTIHLLGRLGKNHESGLVDFIAQPVRKYNRSFLFKLMRRWFLIFRIITFWQQATYAPSSYAISKMNRKWLMMCGKRCSRLQMYINFVRCIIYWRKISQGHGDRAPKRRRGLLS